MCASMGSSGRDVHALPRVMTMMLMVMVVAIMQIIMPLIMRIGIL